MLIVTASFDGTARVWDAKIVDEPAPLAGHTDSVIVASFSNDGTRIVTASLDGHVLVWE
jgi:WD40 repeat protein